MIIFITVVSILVITEAAWVFNRFSTLKICPICAGVSGTWLWMLIGMIIGKLPIADYQLPIAILMGGSIVGIAYQIEKRMPAARSALLWKVLFIPVGFFAVYSLLSFWWIPFLAALIVLVILAIVFVADFRSPAHANTKVAELEQKMKKCC